MSDTLFFPTVATLDVAAVAALIGAEPPGGERDGRPVRGVAPLGEAGPNELAYMDNPRYVGDLEATRAGVCIVSRRFVDRVPPATVPLLSNEPQRAYAAVLRQLHPDASRPGSVFGGSGVMPGSVIHPSARLETGVTVDPGAVIGPRAEIGSGTVVAAGAVVGPEVRIGRDCSIAAGVTIQAALIGNRVIVHPGVRIGQDGFGFAMGARHAKVPQVGRVVIQDDVEIGANTTIDRGAIRDTIIGEGTKIDNLVQIAHNVVIGRHCIIVSQTGISGSATLGDYVVLAGQVGVVGHVHIGDGAQIAGSSNVNGDVPPGSRWGGTPAKPMRDWFRELTTLKTLASKGGAVRGVASRGVSAKDDGLADG